MTIIQTLIKGGAVPSAPTVTLAETVSQATANVYFNPPSVGAPILDYTVTAFPSGVQATGTSSPIQISSLGIRQVTTFSVRARNAAGSGPSSAASNAIQPTNGALTPRSIARVGVDGGIVLGTDGQLSAYQNGAIGSAIAGEWSAATATGIGNYYEVQISSVTGTVSGNSTLTVGPWKLINTPQTFALTTAGSFGVLIRSVGSSGSIAGAFITIT